MTRPWTPWVPISCRTLAVPHGGCAARWLCRTLAVPHGGCAARNRYPAGQPSTGRLTEQRQAQAVAEARWKTSERALSALKARCERAEAALQATDEKHDEIARLRAELAARDMAFAGFCRRRYDGR